ncbi:MAG: WbuC family cupin fold metalloprotein [Lentisphaerae bacterium]|nr:WbuC family cupin fold metalloprotein [Lentisphaerota bacterium]
MKTTEYNAEVLIAAGPVVTVNRADVAELRERALRTKRGRMRLCAHNSLESKVHEMLIVHTAATYVRPHRHLGKSESFHIIEGTAEIILFGDQGAVRQVISMGDYASRRIFYYRLAEAVYHSLVITSPVLVFHEVTSGPLVRSETEAAPWAPDESDGPAVKAFMEKLRKQTV